jgi:hypothetical protein
MLCVNVCVCVCVCVHVRVMDRQVTRLTVPPVGARRRFWESLFTTLFVLFAESFIDWIKHGFVMSRAFAAFIFIFRTTYIQTCTHIHTHIHIHACINSHTYTDRHTYIHIHILYTHLCTRAHI